MIEPNRILFTKPSAHDAARHYTQKASAAQQPLILQDLRSARVIGRFCLRQHGTCQVLCAIFPRVARKNRSPLVEKYRFSLAERKNDMQNEGQNTAANSAG
jgi:hypothetical protein